MAHDYARKQRRPAKGSKSRKPSAPAFSLRTVLSLVVIAAFGWGLFHLYQSKQAQQPTKVATQGSSNETKQASSPSQPAKPAAQAQDDGYSYTFYEKLKETQSYDPSELADLRVVKDEKTEKPQQKAEKPEQKAAPAPVTLPENKVGPVPPEAKPLPQRPRPDAITAPPAAQQVSNNPQAQQTPPRPRPNTSPNVPTNTVAPASKTLRNYPKNAILQAGSYQSYAEANNQRAQMIMNGVRNPRITIVTLPNGQVSHHIEIGPFGSAQELEQTRQSLSRLKISSSVHAE